MYRAIGWQRAEGAIVFLSAIALYGQGPGQFAWWAAVLVFFAPDLAFVAYAFGARIGAVAYNVVHLYGFGTALLAFGLVSGLPSVAAFGALALAHAGFDRMLGYGLKSPSGFSVTHLGMIGKAGAGAGTKTGLS